VARQELTGDQITLANPIDFRSPVFDGFSVAPNGLVAYRTSGQRWQLTWFDRSGRAVGVAAGPDTKGFNYPELSFDDRLIAVDGWWMNTLAGSWNRLTFDAAGGSYLLWSHDGSHVLFASNRKGVRDLYWKPANGAGTDELLLETPYDKVAEDLSKDGRYLLYCEDHPGTGRDLWVLDITEPARKPRPFVSTAADESMGTFSPDGRWVAYETNESGRPEIVVASFANPTNRWQVSVGGGRQPRWHPDGSELYFIAPGGKLMGEPVPASGTAFEVRPATPLFQVQIATTASAAKKPQYAVARDGRFLINQLVNEATIAPITVLMNWNPDIKK
jgi:Tol biopolymer transport system component